MDWRPNKENRIGVIRQLTEALIEMQPGPDNNQKLSELARKFEDQVFNTAKDQVKKFEIVHSFSERLLPHDCYKTPPLKEQKENTNSTQYSQMNLNPSMNRGVIAMPGSAQNPQLIDVMQGSVMGLPIQNNPQVQMANQQVVQIQNPMQMVQQPQYTINSLPPSRAPPPNEVMPRPNQAQDPYINLTGDEKRYWDKHRALQQYMKPLSTMIKQIEKLMNDQSDPNQQHNLQTIQKKLLYMQKLLVETPESKRVGPPIEDQLKILDAAERQMQHWIQQLSALLTGNRFQFPQQQVQQMQQPQQHPQQHPQQPHPSPSPPPPPAPGFQSLLFSSSLGTPQRSGSVGMTSVSPVQISGQYLPGQFAQSSQMQPGIPNQSMQQVPLQNTPIMIQNNSPQQAQMKQNQNHPLQMGVNQQLNIQNQYNAQQTQQVQQAQQAQQVLTQQALNQQAQQALNQQALNQQALNQQALNQQAQQALNQQALNQQMILQQQRMLNNPNQISKQQQQAIFQQQQLQQQAIKHQQLQQHQQMQLQLQQQKAAQQQQAAQAQASQQSVQLASQPSQPLPSQVPNPIQHTHSSSSSIPLPLKPNLPPSTNASATNAPSTNVPVNRPIPITPTPIPAPTRPEIKKETPPPVPVEPSPSPTQPTPTPIPSPVSTEDTKDALLGLLDKVSKLDRDVKELNPILERADRVTSQVLQFSEKKRSFSDITDEKYQQAHLFWWDEPSPSSVAETETVPIKNKVYATESHICDDLQKSLKKRKLSGPPAFSASKILNALKEEISKNCTIDSFFTLVKDNDLPNIMILETQHLDNNVKVFVIFEPEETSPLIHDRHAIIPTVKYGSDLETCVRFPSLVDQASFKLLQDKSNKYFLEPYKLFLKYKSTVNNELPHLRQLGLEISTDEKEDKMELNCKSEKLRLPPVIIEVPLNYPQSSPKYKFDESFDEFLQDMKSQFEHKLRKITAPYTISSIVQTWLSVISETTNSVTVM